MKCPECEFVCSELRDICPRCAADMRPFKKAAGLAITNPKASAAELRSKTSPRAQSSERPAAARAPDPLPAAEPLPQKNPPVQSSARAAAPITAVHGEEVGRLFSEARGEMEASCSSIEFNPEQFTDFKQSEEINLLFDLAKEAVLDPEAERRYASDIARSESRHVAAEALSKQLAQVERFISKPLLSLKGMYKSPQERAAAEQAKGPAPIVQPPHIVQRVVGTMIDLLLIAVLSTIISLLSAAPRYSEISDVVLGNITPDIFDLLTMASIFLCSYLILLVVYPLFALKLFHNTIGGYAAGYELLTLGGSQPRTAHLMVHCLLFPLSLVFFGYLPPLWKKPALHDFLANTALAQKEAE